MQATIAVNKRVAEVPFWAVPHMGNRVQLLTDWDEYGDGSFVYVQGSFGVLDGIDLCDDGSRCALVVFEDDVTQAAVDIPFEHLRVAVPKDVFGNALQTCLEIPGAAGSAALMWLHGVDLKDRLSQSTFYRLRRELLEHSIDIGVPFQRTK